MPRALQKGENEHRETADIILGRMREAYWQLRRHHHLNHGKTLNDDAK